MSFVSDKRHVFVIQLWSEPREIEDAPEQWRGIIEHITSGQRSPVSTVDDITQFIVTFATSLNQQPSQPSSLKARLRRQLSTTMPDDEPPITE